MIYPGPGLLPLRGTFTLRDLAQVIVGHQHLVPVDSSLVLKQQQQLKNQELTPSQP